MARSRSGGGAYAVALVVLGCLFIVTLLFAIIFYTKIEDAEARAETARSEQATYVTSAETAQVTKIRDQYRQENPEAPANITGFKVQQEKIKSLQNQIAGLQAEIASADTRANQAVREYENREDDFAQAQTRIGELEDQLRVARQEAQAQVDQLRNQITALEAERNQLRLRVETAITNADQAAQDRITELNNQLSEKENQIASLEDTISDLDDLRTKYEESIKTNVLTTRVTTPDGQISSIYSNGNDMIISRGREDGVLLGMTFEVFEPDTVIRLRDGTDDIRGKATIEVYALKEDTATARLVRREGNAKLDPGDPIANIIYDPNKTYQFYAYGNFDIEGDGGGNDIDRIRSMVTSAGGEIADLQTDADGLPILVPEVDYLILGKEPEYPVEPDRGEIDVVIIREWQENVRRYEIYQKLVDEAKRLRIPILNQNRFLDLRGYYER